MIDKKKIADYHLDVLLTKMFEMVNLDWKNPEIKEEYKVFEQGSNWFWQNEWTADVEAEYVMWLTDYLYQNSGARRALMTFPMKNRKRCREVASMFTSYCGWKTKRDDEAEG